MKAEIASTFCVLLLGCALVGAQDTNSLINEHHDAVTLPPELYRTYANLIAAMETGKPEEIEKFCVRGTISFTTTPRTDIENQQNFAGRQDINLPFLKGGGFDKLIVLARKDSDTEYLIRTDSTAFWFRRMADGSGNCGNTWIDQLIRKGRTTAFRLLACRSGRLAPEA